VIHAVLDNYATHMHPKALARLVRHPRWTFHFTPNSVLLAFMADCNAMRAFAQPSGVPEGPA
jgi:hypothetical protein